MVIAEETVRRSIKLFIMRLILLEILLELVYFFITGLVEVAERSNGVDWRGVPQIVQVLLLMCQLSLLAYLWFKWSSEYYIIKVSEVVTVTGILQKQERAYPYNNIQSVTVHQGVLSRILNTGTVVIYIPTLGQELEFTDVDDPKKIADKIKEALPYPSKGQFILRK